jgi:hypothetical protein
LFRRRGPLWQREKQLSRDKEFRLSPILTLELERLWQGTRPILFTGALRDISSAGQEAYLLVIERKAASKFMFVTELRLSLRVRKPAIDAFLQSHPELPAEDSLDGDGVAVVARIAKIDRIEVFRDGSRQEILTGHGELLGLVYTGDVDP